MNYIFSSESVSKSIHDSVMKQINALALDLFLARQLERTYTLQSVSEAMNLPCGTVLSILNRKGYNTDKGFSTRVTREMLDVLADVYVNTLRSVFETVSRDPVHNLEMFHTIISFYKLYKHDGYPDLKEYLCWEYIDEGKVRQDFFNKVEPEKDNDYFENSSSIVVVRSDYDSIRYYQRKCKRAHDYFSALYRRSPILALTFTDFNYNTSLDEEYGPAYSGTSPKSFTEQTENHYKNSLLIKMTSYSDPTSAKSKTLTSLTQSTSSGTFVRQVLLPHRYCIFGTSDDDDHDSTHMICECNQNYKHGSCGMEYSDYDTTYRRA